MSELQIRKTVDLYRRNLQKSYVNILCKLLDPPKPTTTIISGFTISSSSSTDKSDIGSVVRGHLASLRSEMNAAAVGTPDLMTKYHLQDLSKRIDNALNAKD